MAWGIPLIVVVALLVVGLVVRRRHISAAEGMQLLGGVPAAPTLPALEYLYPGRGTPPDPDVRETPVTFVDRRPDHSLPPGVRRKSQDPADHPPPGD